MFRRLVASVLFFLVLQQVTFAQTSLLIENGIGSAPLLVGTQPPILTVETMAAAQAPVTRAAFQGRFLSAKSFSLKSFTPNPIGPNLALSALATADSSYPGSVEYPESLFLPHFVNDGVLNASYTVSGYFYNFWHSNFGRGHWVRLSWPSPVTISRIIIDHQANLPFVHWVDQTYSHFDYFDPASGLWRTIPRSTYVAGFLQPSRIDFTFAPITTTSLIVYLYSGPRNPHPHGAVYIMEWEVYGPVEQTHIVPVGDHDPFAVVGRLYGHD